MKVGTHGSDPIHTWGLKSRYLLSGGVGSQVLAATRKAVGGKRWTNYDSQHMRFHYYRKKGGRKNVAKVAHWGVRGGLLYRRGLL